MKNVFNGLLLLGLSLLITGSSGLKATKPGMEDPGQYALDYACGVLEVDCSELESPEIMFGNLRALQGAYGYYWHQQTPGILFLVISFRETIEKGNPTINPRGWSVLVHEAVHYVDHALGTYRGSCPSEQKAWHTGNLWLLEQGYWKEAVWNWTDYYNGCEGSWKGAPD